MSVMVIGKCCRLSYHYNIYEFLWSRHHCCVSGGGGQWVEICCLKVSHSQNQINTHSLDSSRSIKIFFSNKNYHSLDLLFPVPRVSCFTDFLLLLFITVSPNSMLILLYLFPVWGISLIPNIKLWSAASQPLHFPFLFPFPQRV